MRHVGCTATRYGATDRQLATCSRLLFEAIGNKRSTAHHGMCIGGDAQFHALCRAYHSYGWIRIVGHPGLPADHRADVECDEVREPMTHMKRNATIVSEVAAAERGVMIAMPLHVRIEPRPNGGTWATTFMALRKLRAGRLAALHVIAPNGELLDHSGWRLR